MGWPKYSIQSLSEIFTDGDWIESKHQSSSGIRLIQTGNIGEGVFKDRQDKARYISKETFTKLKCFEVIPRDCLISRLPDPVGRACLIPKINGRAITSVDCTVVRFQLDKIEPRFFQYYSMSREYLQKVNSLTSGATRKRISRKNLGQVEIPLPELSEQKRIVAILDEAFADIDKARALTEQNLKNARELFESYLQQVFGERGSEWKSSLLKNITSKIGSGATPRGGKDAYKTEGLSLIRSLNVYDRAFKTKGLARIDSEQAERLKNVMLEKGDVLLNITGASVARCCMVPDEVLPARVNQHVSIIRVNAQELLPDFLMFGLTSSVYKEQLLGIGEAGSTRQAITKSQIENFLFWYPNDISKQHDTVTKIENIKHQSDEMIKLYELKVKSLNNLKISVLQKAFSGQLTT